MRSVVRSSLVLAALAGAATLAVASPCGAAEPTGALRAAAPILSVASTSPSGSPSLSVASTSPVLEQVGKSWTTAVTVGYNGPVQATDLRFVLVVTSPVLPATTSWPKAKGPAPAPGTAVPYTLVFTPDFTVVPSSAEIVVETTGVTAQASPVTVTLVVRRNIGWWREVGWPLVAGLVFVGVFLALTLRHKKGAQHPIASSTWSFKDSWATNITGAGAVLGAIITATGAVTSAFPGVPLYRFSLFFAAMGGVTAIAPMVLGLTAAEPPPTTSDGPKGAKDKNEDSIELDSWSLLTGQSLTLVAVAGELTALAMLVWWSSAVTTARVLLIAAIGLAALVVLAYAVRSTVSLYPAPAEVKKRHEAGTRTRSVFYARFAPTSERAAAL